MHTCLEDCLEHGLQLKIFRFCCCDGGGGGGGGIVGEQSMLHTTVQERFMQVKEGEQAEGVDYNGCHQIIESKS